jgi:predicted transcriptional regulator of viral defense system
MMRSERSAEILELAGRRGVIGPRDLKEHGIPHGYLQRMLTSGILQRVGRGTYMLPDAEMTENFSLVEACSRVPDGVVCLLSALRFHKIGTQNPHQVWVAVGLHSHQPRVDYPPLRIVRFSQSGLTREVQRREGPDGTVVVFGVAKTIADCFRYRNKIGLDVALEALRECWRDRRATMDELWREATLGRIASVMRPYLETLE